ncbi:CLUMA_CG020274, isoform A [Clunio marinus]|uniref:CLUMA_CG020274, isoform A n=1 Tax=Clunio marinus TaxID=568069 RepID=A0A1J1J4H6_9DIPT|nr:CLUMA_CG020274, isoform A [Clunio marinus]
MGKFRFATGKSIDKILTKSFMTIGMWKESCAFLENFNSFITFSVLAKLSTDETDNVLALRKLISMLNRFNLIHGSLKINDNSHETKRI